LEQQLNALPAPHGTWPNATGAPIVYAAASGDYAETFAHDLIESVLSKSAGIGFHFHVMNPGAFDIAKVLAAFPGGRLTVTHEDIGACEKTIYSTRRFLRLAQFMARIRRRFVAVDADSLFNGDVSAHELARGTFDAAIYLRDDQYFINQMINASVLAFSPTAEGRAFLDFVAAYILHFETLGTSRWFVDQMALIAARTWFKDNVSRAVIALLPANTIDWSDARESASLIWTQKGKAKIKIAEA
jgi:hypothetical protein